MSAPPPDASDEVVTRLRGELSSARDDARIARRAAANANDDAAIARRAETRMRRDCEDLRRELALRTDRLDAAEAESRTLRVELRRRDGADLDGLDLDALIALAERLEPAHASVVK